jgi:hypothetical protein
MIARPDGTSWAVRLSVARRAVAGALGLRVYTLPPCIGEPLINHHCT